MATCDAAELMSDLVIARESEDALIGKGVLHLLGLVRVANPNRLAEKSFEVPLSLIECAVYRPVIIHLRCR